jgi:hypothetical protein
MKNQRILYLIPALLALLCFTPLQLHKDTINFGSSLDTFSPSHWKLIDLQFGVSASVDSGNTNSSTSASSTQPEPVSKDASYKGFPFGAYFSRSTAKKSSTTTSNFSASGWSWLWALVDTLIIIISLLLAVFINRKKNVSEITDTGLNTQPMQRITIAPETSAAQIIAPQSAQISPSNMAPMPTAELTPPIQPPTVTPPPPDQSR